MASQKVLEQHIAVFGASGSGKTVLLSSFYGAAQEPKALEKRPFHVIAENPSQGTHLHQNYLGMKNSATVPAQNQFAATSYRFLLRLKGETGARPLRARPFDAVRLIWHDYPGEWFEQDVSGPEEAQRRVDTFRSLLGSHVAMLLVDGQRLIDNAGEEERYLKSLLGSLRNTLMLLRDDLIEDGKPLVTFPRIWVIALSKADLLPDIDVQGFKELVIEKVGDDLVQLRTLLGELVDSDAALSVGEDFILVSSAKFSPHAIAVTERVGVELILPMASVLPLERHLRWAKAEKMGKKVAVELLGAAEVLASGVGVAGGIAASLMGRSNKMVGAIGLALHRFGPGLEDALKTAAARLEAGGAETASKQQNLAATLEGFRQDLNTGEENSIFIRSLG